MGQQWTTVITPKKSKSVGGKSAFRQAVELTRLFVVRDCKTMYTQTVLGPLWFVLSALLTSSVFTVVFGGIAKLSTDGVPRFVFYMAGSILWSYFSSCLAKISETFRNNARLFGKVYFPRLTVPVSVVFSKMVIFGVQFLIFLAFVIYYAVAGVVRVRAACLLLPVVLLQSAILALGCGLILTSITAKYRDMAVMVSFLLQAWMYITPVVYPASAVPEAYRWLYMLNPVTPFMEAFRYGFLGVGTLSWGHMVCSATVALLVFGVGYWLFKRTERTFIDVV
ncbi:MAG: ABC transporter permease [Clostridia bacterium]|nr:ABC transporter permease [Clostridia bacterium]